jgi:hypothetical protein
MARVLGGEARPAPLLAALTILSALAKPSHLIALVPAAAVLSIVLAWSGRPPAWRSLLLGLAIPAAIALGLQFALRFGGASVSVEWAPLRAMAYRDANLGARLVLSALFPLVAMAAFPRALARDRGLALAAATFAVGAAPPTCWRRRRDVASNFAGAPTSVRPVPGRDADGAAAVAGGRPALARAAPGRLRLRLDAPRHLRPVLLPAPHVVVTRPSREALYRAVLATVALALGFAGVEAYARHRERALHALRLKSPDVGLARANPFGTGSYRLRAGLDVETWVKGQRVRIRTNSHGMRWREVALAKPPRVRRVAFLGDSFVFGCWAPSAESSFVGVFERGYPGGRIEALNFGVGGYGTVDEELQLREEVLPFSPDWVVVGLFTGNDFRDTWLGLDKHRLREDGVVELRDDVLEARVPAAYREAPNVTAEPAPDPSRLRAALERLATFRLLLPALGWDNPWIEFPVCRRFTSLTFWSLVPPPPVALQARDEVLAALGRMNQVSAEHGARLAVVAIPTREQVYARRETGALYDTALPQAWVHVWAREQGVPYLDLLPLLRGHALEHSGELYVAGDIHWNERGHALVGQWVRDWFREEVRPRGFVADVEP